VPFPKAKPTTAPLSVRLRLCEAAVDVLVSEAEAESIRLEIHPRCHGEPVSDHVTGHYEKQDKHDDDRTGLGGSEHRREAALPGGGGERDGLFRRERECPREV